MNNVYVSFLFPSNRIDMNWIQNYPSHAVFQWTAGGQVALCGDAHHQERLESHQDVLERIPHVREEEDEGLVLQVKVKVLGHAIL